MKKVIVLLAGMMLLFVLAACGSSEEDAAASEPAAGETITLNINTDGMGQIAYAPVGGELQFDDEFPAQSAQENLTEPAAYVLGAKADDGWKFVKWTKDGEDYSTDEEITVEVDASVEYIAYFDIE